MSTTKTHPNRIPKCSCGMVSEWRWDNTDEEWFETICFRCLEIEAMKDPNNGILQAMLPMDSWQMDRFIDIVTRQDSFLETVTVKRFDDTRKPLTFKK